MLTALQVARLTPKNKVYRIADSHGLNLEVTPSGKKIWRGRFFLNNKASMTSIGEFPRISLAEAREINHRNRELVRKGINPNHVHLKKQDKIHLFSAVHQEWLGVASKSWTKKTYSNAINDYNKNLKPIHNVSITEINAQFIINLLKQIEKRQALLILRRCKSQLSRVFRYGVGMGYCERDPTNDIPNELFQRHIGKHYAYSTDTQFIAHLLTCIDNYHSNFNLSIALRIAPHIFLRPIELLTIHTDNLDLPNRIIRLSAQITKTRQPHLVPMSNQVLSLIETITATQTPGFLFKHAKKQTPFQPDSLRRALREIGIRPDQLTPHGFRHIASTILNENGWNTDAIELQLAHKIGSSIKATYNHAQHLETRHSMMQWWSDHLDSIRNQKNI